MTKTLPLYAMLLASTLSFSQPALAVDEYNVSSGLTAAGAPLGVHGIDPVSLLKSGKRISGSAEYSAVHDGAAYYFSSQKNLDQFKSSPVSFLPQNGGFCTFGVSKGKKFDGDPNYATVIDGKLYVFLNAQIFKLFQKDKAGTISQAEANWPKIQHIAASEL
ncbi:MAG: YHS domain-containing (seleno)protein [Rhizobiaceae bacterium]